MDEGIAMMRAVWKEDPVSFSARHIPAVVEDMRMLPQPVKPIPIWIGGSSEAALARAVKLADGWHGSRLSPEEAAPIVRRLRERRPDAGFAISLRYGWGRQGRRRTPRPFGRLWRSGRQACSGRARRARARGLAARRRAHRARGRADLREWLVNRHSGARARPASPEPMHTGLFQSRNCRCSWIPGLPLRGIPE
jgi:alkanesulfonate monooxygenase SsuD/methylene tetrahydromethanopterin reductase-like flavin-dependent oxidoreductase (luciferase family)